MKSVNNSRLILLLGAAAVVAFAAVLIYLFRQTAGRSAERRREITLIVYAPKSFIDTYGPGLEIKNRFEAKCECTVEYVDVGGAVTAIEKMKLDPKRRVDVVVGVDLLMLDRVFHSVVLREIDRPQVKLRDEMKSMMFPRFIAYDWSPMGFVYRKGEIAPAGSLAEFLQSAPEKSLAIEDPELSSAGLEWLFWLFQTQTDFAAGARGLQRVTAAVTPTWSTAYGLFKKSQAKAAFSYLTSLVYHTAVEKDERYQFMEFSEGHPMQIEYAFVPDSCWNCDSAARFVTALLEPATQKLIAETNYMYPVVADIELIPEFSRLPKVKVLDPMKDKTLDDFNRRQNELIQTWKNSKP